jgi:GT2 family glycosyltransferase
MNELMRVHRTLCSAFVSEDLFRNAFGGGRADLGNVVRYLQIPLPERPNLSFYFDRAYYLATNPDLERASTDPLVHFIETGVAELRSPHPLVDLKFIYTEDPNVLGATPNIEALLDLLEYDLLGPSPYFDPREYQARMGGGAPANGMLRHYLSHGLFAGEPPNPYLDPGWYAEKYPDAPKDFYGALRHFIILGDIEARAAGPMFDGQLYRARYPDVADLGMPPLYHFLTHGRREGRQAASDQQPPPGRAIAERSVEAGLALPVDPDAVQQAWRNLRSRLEEMRYRQKEAVVVAPPPMRIADALPGGLDGLEFPAAGAPRLSILIPAYNEIDYTVECLLSIRHALPETPFEVLLADDGSTDPEMRLLAGVPNLRVLRQPENVGFIGNCNLAYAACRGEFVLLLNNDAQVQPGAIDRMVAALDADATLAAVGPKIIYPNGRLQEAGCFLRPNGESGMVGLFGDPADASYCYDRDVAYCSGAALMVRRSHAGETLFDEAFRPAYCEDADLCLRLQAAGHRVRYLHGAVVVHHLSVSSNRQSTARRLRMVTTNQQKLVERWGELIGRMDRVRVLAFHLPQFHTTPENDLWWGAGFTEWTNVARARPSYAGHYQPHLPADLGYYDLRTADALRRQAELAARYGIEGFCVYYYNFGSRQVLSQPIEVVRAHPEIPFRWCLCWANENWTKHWDGGTREILLEQRYDAATLEKIIADAVEQAADPRYIRVNDRPLFLVYRPLQLPDAPGFAANCRAAFVRAGFAGVHLVYVESMEAVDRKLRPADFGFDACVEFPPHGRAVASRNSAEIIKDDWVGYRYDYPETVLAFIRREPISYPRYPAVFPSWDNTPRQRLRGTSFDAASPEVFRCYVEEKIEEIRQFHMGDERLLFVNAWNEWAEGTHLEPDTGFGHRWLEALRDAVAAKRCA